MEYSFPKVLVMAAAILMAAGDDHERSYETNHLRNSDLTQDGYGQQLGHGSGYDQLGNGYDQGDYGYDKGDHGYDKGGHEKGGEGKDYYAVPHYAFAYEVHDDHTGDIKAHKEERKGDHTQGMYMLVEPNGSKRIVEYVVQGKSGFSAKVHQSKPQHGGNTGHTAQGSSSGGYSGQTGGHVGYSGGDSGHTGGHTGNTGGYAVHTGGYTGNSGGYSGYTGGYTSNSGGYSGYTGGYSSNSGGYSGYTGGYTSNSGVHAANTGASHSTGLGDYATGYYTSNNQAPYKVQENALYNDNPSSFKPSFQLQSFKPLTPYSPSGPQNSKNSFPYSKPLVALYRPQTSYKPLNKPVSYKLIPKHRQSYSDSNQGHATSSVSFLSHGSKIASTTNHVIPRQSSYENKH